MSWPTSYSENKFGASVAQIRLAFEKGLLKRTRSNFELQSQAGKNYYATHKMSDEIKTKISISRKKYLASHPEDIRYLKYHYSKGRSYPEQYFYDWLIKEKIEFQEQIHVSHYTLDFLIGNIDFEIDGIQHYNDKKIFEHDKKRNIFMLNHGLHVLRLNWSEYSKLNHEERVKALSKLSNLIKNKNDYRDNYFIFITHPNDVPKIQIKQKKDPNEISEYQKRQAKIIQNRKIIIETSNLDYNSMGWLSQLSRLLQLSHTQTKRFMLKYFPDLYYKSWHKKK